MAERSRTEFRKLFPGAGARLGRTKVLGFFSTLFRYHNHVPWDMGWSRDLQVISGGIELKVQFLEGTFGFENRKKT